ncbi:MAG: 30S ribosomal protein S4e [Candidatus Pacearchaeota archaeon]|nr:30S ribosomal protein S4e [Nanoarchaeota archaeon]MDZ4226521.1 30S ribosomal protein S4e [Candidatus Pacearchaeota archaeon]
MHLKRHEVPKSWPIYRKGTKYVIRPKSDIESGIPLLVVLRDMLNVVQNRKEARRSIFLKQILVNNKIPKDEKKSLLLFDTISLIPEKKNYRLDLSEKGKFELKEINENEINRKAVKIVNKRMLKGKKVQLNLHDGRNILSDMKCEISDSVLINFSEKKIEKCLPLKEGSEAVVFAGKHSGKRGNIKSLDRKKKIAEMETDKKEKINVLIKQIIVVG